MSQVAPIGGSKSRQGFRWALREATRGAHDAIHEMTPFAELMRGGLERNRYVDVVIAICDYHSSAKCVLAHADQLLDYNDPGFDGRARRALIEADLAALGHGDMPRKEVLVPDARPGWNIGFSYVVRGSSIGGRAIYTALDGLFGSEEDGRRFFRGPVGETQRWNEFCARLEKLDRDALMEDATEGAAAAFAHFRSCMEGRCLR